MTKYVDKHGTEVRPGDIYWSNIARAELMALAQFFGGPNVFGRDVVVRRADGSPVYRYRGGQDVRVGDRYEYNGYPGTVANLSSSLEMSEGIGWGLCTLLRRAEEKPSETRHDFREGDRVRMISGTFAGATGVVTRDTGDTHCVPVKLDHEDFYPRRMPPENVERITDEKAEVSKRHCAACRCSIPDCVPTFAHESGSWCRQCHDTDKSMDICDVLESLSRALARPTRAQRYQLFRRAVTSAVSKQPTMRAVTDYVSGNFVAWITAPLAGEKRFLVPEGRDVNYLTLAEQWVWDMAELVRVVAGARVLGKREKDSERDQRIADAHARWLAELPEAAADAALELVEDLLGSRALPAEERREVVERVSLEMMREFKIKEAGR